MSAKEYPPRKAKCMFYVPRSSNYCICEQCIKAEFEAGTADPQTTKAVRATDEPLKFRCHGCLRLNVVMPSEKEPEHEQQDDRLDLVQQSEDSPCLPEGRGRQDKHYLPSVQQIMDQLS